MGGNLSRAPLRAPLRAQRRMPVLALGLTACALSPGGTAPDARPGIPAAAPARVLPAAPDGLRTLVCGDRPVRLGMGAGPVPLVLDHRQVTLVPVRSASGARYRSPGGDVELWSRGLRARLTVAGETGSECAWAPASTPLTVRGNEPFWHLEIREKVLRYAPAEPGTGFTVPRPEGRVTAKGFEYATNGGEGPGVRVVLEERLCHDSMSGMPYPVAARFTRPHGTQHACAGDPAWLLTPGRWRVRAGAGGASAGAHGTTIDFHGDGTVTGEAGCNRYRASWSLSGEGLRVGGPATTRRGCPAAVMDRERRFLRLLEAVRRFDVVGGAGLVLVGSEGTLELVRGDG